MTLGQFDAVVRGWNAAQGGDKASTPPPMTGDEFNDLVARHARYLH